MHIASSLQGIGRKNERELGRSFTAHFDTHNAMEIFFPPCVWDKNVVVYGMPFDKKNMDWLTYPWMWVAVLLVPCRENDLTRMFDVECMRSPLYFCAPCSWNTIGSTHFNSTHIHSHERCWDDHEASLLDNLHTHLHMWHTHLQRMWAPGSKCVSE